MNREHVNVQYRGYFDERLEAWTVQEFFRACRGVVRQDVNPCIPGTETFDAYEALIQERQREALRPFLGLPDAPVVKLPSKRRMPQPTFKMPFDTLHDARLRLCGSLIFIGSYLFYVQDVYEHDGDYLLVVDDKDGKRYKTYYNRSNAIDLRSLEPQYVTLQNQPGYVFRAPSRVQRQGMSGENLRIKAVGDKLPQSLRNTQSLMAGLTTRMTLWSPAYSNLMLVDRVFKSIRLSKNIAFYRNKDSLVAEFRGRDLGVVNEDTVTVDEQDARRPWIKDAIQAVNCQVRVK